MKIPLACSLLLGALLPALAAPGNPMPSVPAKAPAPAPSAAAPAATPPADTAKSSVSLDAFVADLAGQLPLSKDEQTDIKAYYQDDGAKIQDILGNASLSPLQQEQQIDALRNTRNAKIEALLKDPDRQALFLQLENGYRVALVQLAAEGGLTPKSPPGHPGV
jgi:hypothetical protein